MTRRQILSLETGDDIAEPLPAHIQHRDVMVLPETLKGGTRAMRRAARLYLPQEEGESDKRYEARLARSVLRNTYWETVTKLASDVFRKDLTLSEDLPQEIKELRNDIDLKGNSMSTWCQRFLENAIHYGVNHAMIEYPIVEGKTRADHKAAGARPYWVEIKPENVIGWRFTEISGKPVLSQLRVKEIIIVDNGLYGVDEVERIRLYEPGYWAVYEEGDQGWEIATDQQTGQPLAGNTNLDFIPLVSFMIGQPLSEMTAVPCLEGLADLNCTHWQSSSDQRNILHYVRMALFFGKALDIDDGGQVAFAVNSLVHASDPNADLKVVEHSGKGIEAGRNDLMDLETAMGMYGLSLLMPKTGTVTATEKAIDKSENDSVLGGWIKQLDSALNTMLTFTCAYLATEQKGSIKCTIDYRALLGSTDATILIEAFKVGLLPRQLVIEEMKARGLITQEIDLPDLLAMLEEDRRVDATELSFETA